MTPNTGQSLIRNFDFSEEDRVPKELYNKILWKGIKGTPAPAVKTRFAKATATITANFLKDTVRFFCRGAYKFRDKWIRGVWAVEETAGKQTYRFFDEAEQVWGEAADGPAYIKCSWCKYTGTGEAAALQAAVDEIVEDLLPSAAYASGGKLLVDPTLIRDVLKAYGAWGDHVVEMIASKIAIWPCTAHQLIKLFFVVVACGYFGDKLLCAMADRLRAM